MISRSFFSILLFVTPDAEQVSGKKHQEAAQIL
jgi:hypothetical protein